MPIKYVGKSTSYNGKTLWELLGNLRDFGVGRVVVRSQFERYPEPTYFRVLRAEPEMDKDNSRGRVWVEKVFRGRPYPGPYEMSRVGYKPDYRLLHKHEEEAYCNRYSPPEKETERILPREIPVPPLLRELIKAEKERKGEELKEEPMLTMKYLNTWYNRYRVAEEGEKHNVEFGRKLMYIDQPQNS